MTARSFPAPMLRDVLPRRGQAAPIFRLAAAHVRASAMPGSSIEKAGRELYGRDGIATRAVSTQATLGDASWFGVVGHDVLGDLLQEATTLGRRKPDGPRPAGFVGRHRQLADSRPPGRSRARGVMARGKRAGTDAGAAARSRSDAATEYRCVVGLHGRTGGQLVDRCVHPPGVDRSDRPGARCRDVLERPGGAQPPGISTNAVTVTASTAGAGWAMSSDIGSLVEGLSSVGAGADPVLIASPHQYASMHTWLSETTKFYPVFASTALPSGTIVAIERSSFVSSYDPVPDFSSSIGSAVHMESATPTDIVAGGTPATPVKSFFQTDVVGLNGSESGVGTKKQLARRGLQRSFVVTPMTKEGRDAWRERLAIERAELIEDIERRQLDIDMATTRRGPTPEVIFKVHRDNGGSNGDGAAIGDLNGDVPAVDRRCSTRSRKRWSIRRRKFSRSSTICSTRCAIASLRSRRKSTPSCRCSAPVTKSLGRKRAPKLLAPPK